MLSDADTEDHFSPSVRLLEIEKPETGSCGFHLTRGKWDPYPWISGVDVGSAAYSAGMRAGDCVLEVNGEDIVGQRVSDVGQLVRSHPGQVSLLLWNAGVGANCSADTLCCGPMPNNLQKLSACLSSVLTFLECPVCLDTAIPPTYQCDNGHLICMRCRAKSERCPVCRVRFTSGRSLLADQVYNAFTDAFDLREDTHEARSAKMQQIFKIKSKKAPPSIKITQAHTNKFLARLIGKASSVDNLSSKHPQAQQLLSDGQFASNMKAKSLSSSEIFNPDSSSIARTGSINSIHRTHKPRPGSYHGSFETLHVPDISMISANPQEGILYHCPYEKYCTCLIKGADIINHFKNNHSGPLTQYFNNKMRLLLSQIPTGGTYLISINDQLFFLKINHENMIKGRFGNMRIWAWLTGDKKHSTESHLLLNFFNEDTPNDSLMSIRSAVYSLSSVSWSDINETKKGVFISSQSLQAICSESTILEAEIL
ncbi:PREDICTED: uncharacterized protein LOC108565865 [Nicrophorus vespilloides]|uniref:Uncharacterized protein LOC108565865 n=1 Tax=Nicrophorus vespilloides TaxID=110193 RepID=A0ABM1N2G4_NICVS|nr:PREDICTED: uncharacterized protein LOC108565865 [Nicrophorus vespilloides]